MDDALIFDKKPTDQVCFKYGIKKTHRAIAHKHALSPLVSIVIKNKA